MGSVGKSYSVNPKDYKLLEEVGHGASATVHRAIYIPFNQVVAVKCLDLDRCNSNLDDIRREAQTMSLIDHPNVISAYCSFVVDQNLWVVMPFMAEGSCLHLMKIAYSDGFEESAIGSILKETLKALEYLHQHGHIHRDVKAGNILLDSNGMVKVADFGVSACMFDRGDRKRSRNTFVGTPCWMAPEVLQPGSGYDFKADIWSFGITALELAHGHAPFSKYPPMKVLLMTIQNAPPGLDSDRDKKFSKSFKEMVAMCLVKDQTKRPTAEKLLKHSFFKQAKPPELSVKKLFADLPPLWNRVEALQRKDAAQLALKKMPSAEQEAISQSEYQRGVSAWNFDIEDLKVQASLVQDDDEIQEIREEYESMKPVFNYKKASNSRFSVGKSISTNDIICSEQTSDEFSSAECLSNKGKVSESDLLESDYQGKIDPEKNGSRTEPLPSTSERDIVLAKIKTSASKSRQTQSGPLMPSIVLNHSVTERGHIFERSDHENQPLVEKPHREVRKAPSFSGPLKLPNRASANSLSAPIKSSGGFRDSLEDKSKTNLVQIKGRFSVTSENVDLVKDIPLCTVPRLSSQGSPLRKSASVGDWIFESKQMPIGQLPKEMYNSNLPASILMPHLQNLFHQTSIQQDLIMNLLSSLQPAELADVSASQNGQLLPLPHSSENNGIVESAVSEREHLLLIKISELQARMITLTSELTSEKLKFIQLQQQLNAVSGREEDGDRRDENA
ncbi:STE20/SPS1-related proline-alanine-rich protein kinase-like isoform X3 [Camellia sinensis]|uniref:STE20/SPS1-related proline-alanine-rich protein kinase-like isoform X3 n=1 Tax=Camellia sinensis TaxID=4442 RepID=UPI0010367873|nr:STE20/SPS1-related proline-alanine-rich protein kinase-like isoform X3 [Camellia sinensis]